MLKTIENIQALSALKSCHMTSKQVRYFSAPDIISACGRIKKAGIDEYLLDVNHRSYTLRPIYERIEKELLSNPWFAGFYIRVKSASIDEPILCSWLKEADRLGESITDCGTAEMFSNIHQVTNPLAPKEEYEAVKYFGQVIEESAEQTQMLARNLEGLQHSNCCLSDLTDSQRSLLLKPYFQRSVLLQENTALKSMEMLSKNIVLQDIVMFIYDNAPFKMDLTYSNIKDLETLRNGDQELIRRIFANLNGDAYAMRDFISLWLKNRALDLDLNWMANHGPFSEEERTKILSNQLAYSQTLYFDRFHIPSSCLMEPNQLDVFVLGIKQKKRHFLTLVAENIEDYCSIPSTSILFDKGFLERFNLNTLTLKNLRECKNIQVKPQRRRTDRGGSLTELLQREYTFNELKLLLNMHKGYVHLYNMLDGLGVDSRLIIMRELVKKDLLPEELSEEQTAQLARYLTQMPLSVWKEKKMANIRSLSSADTIRILLVYEDVARFLPQVKNREEALFVAKNIEALRAYTSWEDAKKDLLSIDTDWESLSEEMELSDEFVEENLTGIQSFLMKGGSEMSLSYLCRSRKQRAFCRIVKAELMGKFHDLKYFPDDLEKEISYSLSDEQLHFWMDNATLRDNEILAYETDDFYSTLRLGELPYRTCISYNNGVHSDCLLSAFDSNKKILLAQKGGEIVGRAIVRLTKSCEQINAGTPLEFADLTQPMPKQPMEADKKERLTLFLERLYISRCSPQEEKSVNRLFIRMMRKKAEQIGANFLLASSYQNDCDPADYSARRCYLYISRSKGGEQYLDSLGGSATVSDEGKYKKGNFLALRNVPAND